MTDQLAVEAERRILGAMMLGATEIAMQHLAPKHFFQPRHALIYNHLGELWAGGEPTDPVLLGKRLADHGELQRVGGVTYLTDLYADACLPAQVGHYAAIVLGAAHQRDVAVLAAQIEGVARIEDNDVRRAKLAELLAAAVPAAAAERDSWAPIDLGPYLDGTVVRPEPSVGIARRDGIRLLYPGKEHAVIGEMESGKSWFSLACVAAELAAGNVVVYIHFEEADPADSVERLQVLGVPDERIRGGFRFVGPTKPITAEALTRLLLPAPTLVVLDGQNEGMALHAQAIREEDGAAAFRRLLVKPWTEVGAAVLACDHVVKDREARGRYALGSIHKGNAINGSLLLLESQDPFGRGRRGTSRVYAVKDRPGFLRRHGQSTKTSGKTYLGQLVVDDSRTWLQCLDLAFLAPSEDKPVGEKPENPIGGWVLDCIARQPEQTVSSERTLFALLRKEGIQVREGLVRDTLDDLVVDGRLTETVGARGAKAYRIPTAAPTAAQDQREFLI